MYNRQLPWYFLIMNAVYFFLVPVLYVYLCASFEKQSIYREGFSYILGVIGAFGTALLYWLLSRAVPSDSLPLMGWFLRDFTLETLIPYVALPMLLLLLFYASLRNKVYLVMSMIFGIATVFLPLTMLLGTLTNDLWSALMIPLSYTSFLFASDFAFRGIKSRNPSMVSDLFPEILYPLAILLILSLLKAVWFFAGPSWLYWTGSILLVGIGFFLRLYKYFR